MRLCFLAYVAAFTCFVPAGASADMFRKFGVQVDKGLSDVTRTAIDRQKPDILMTAPPSGAASEAIATFESRQHPKMIGGVPMRIEDVNWQAGLLFASGPEPVRVQFCGGSLINANWILTAAHCVDNGTKASDVDIVLGTAFYKHFGERLKVKRLIVHEKWNSSSMENDIALLELEKPATQGTIVELAASELSLIPGTELRVSGWGALSEGGQGSEILMGADIPTVSNEICNLEASYAGRIKPSMICAGLRDGGLDSCQGDSGGPAVATTEAGKKVLTGVVSWGTGCARRLKYGVYTSVAAHRPWIDKSMKPAP